MIIHVTGSLEVLKSILHSSSLSLSYSKERFSIGGRIISNAVHPMVCFSEYDIREIANKTITYGKYGIAFTKEWALKNCVSPVLYIDGKSLAAKGLATLLNARRNKERPKLPKNLARAIIEIKCFTKNVRGYNSYFKKHNFDFKNENEWRYVPRKCDIGGNFISENLRTYLKNPNRYNKKLIPYPLKFKLSDIEVVFISREDERSEIENEFSINSNKIRISEWRT